MRNIYPYLNSIENLDDKNYIYLSVIHTISPTIEGIKPSNLVCLKNINSRNLVHTWLENIDFYKNKFKELNIKFYELRRNDNCISLLFYNQSLLKESLNNKESQKFLERFGYSKNINLQESLELLSSRFSHFCPHEIGIFLGYPIEDVIDFIDKKDRKECLLVGYWRVYNDVNKAKHLFSEYDKSRKKYYEKINKNLDNYLCS